MKIKVTKASGRVEDINPDKLRMSLTRSGADRDLAQEIIEKVLQEIEPYTSTKKIYRLAQKYLRQANHASGMRYSLKRALFRLGPSGYPFERYYGELLKNYGYEVNIGLIMQGRCVKHEIDVLAISNNEVSVIECKYRNSAGGVTDVKVAMYAHSRFQDLKPVFTPQYPDKEFTGWLVTNTRCTSDALQYAECSGFKVKSWGYPDNMSLEKMIEEKRLYPVTIISGIKSGLIGRLIKENVILLKDLAEMEVKDIKKLLSLPEKKAFKLKKQADELCLC
jgi:Holliday junction resolvase-like predicted endonuclease